MLCCVGCKEYREEVQEEYSAFRVSPDMQYLLKRMIFLMSNLILKSSMQLDVD